MNRIVIEHQVGDNGSLQLNLPLGTEVAGRSVRVTIEPINSKHTITQDEWQAGILATAGGWQGEFELGSEGELEERKPLS